MSFGWAMKEPLLIVTKVVDNAREDLSDRAGCFPKQWHAPSRVTDKSNAGGKISNSSMKIILK